MNKYLRVFIVFAIILSAGSSAALAKNKRPSKPQQQASAGSNTPMFTTEITDSSGAWPRINHGYAIYEPSQSASEEEAISTIRSSMGYIFVGGQKPYDATVDRYTVIYKTEWTETNTYEENVPTTGGFFIGWDYIPTFSNTVQTYHETKQKHDSLTIEFKQIKSIYFYMNTLCIEGAGGTSYIAADSAARLKPLADAIYTLAVKAGAGIRLDMLFILTHITDSQCRMLDIETGDMVTSLFENSEAYKAGIRESDIILNLKEINSAGGFTRKYFAAGNSLKLLRWEQKGSVINYKNIEIKFREVK